MKPVERLYDRLSPTERFQIAVAAFGRGDMAEVDRLNDSTAFREVKVQEPPYFNRLQRIVWLALYFTVDVRNLQLTIFAAFSALTIHVFKSDSDAAEGKASEDDAKFDALVDLCQQRVSRLKALHAAWVEFCAGLGVSTGDIDNMLGEPFLGRVGPLEVIAGIVGEVTPDEEYERQYLDVMTRFWNTKIRDRYRA